MSILVVFSILIAPVFLILSLCFSLYYCCLIANAYLYRKILIIQQIKPINNCNFIILTINMCVVLPHNLTFVRVYKVIDSSRKLLNKKQKKNGVKMLLSILGVLCNVALNYIIYNLILSTPKNIINVIIFILSYKIKSYKLIKQNILRYIYEVTEINNNKRIIIMGGDIILNGALNKSFNQIYTKTIGIDVNGVERRKYVIGRYINGTFEPFSEDKFLLLHSSYKSWAAENLLKTWDNPNYSVNCYKRNSLYPLLCCSNFRSAIIISSKNHINILMSLEEQIKLDFKVKGVLLDDKRVISRLSKSNVLTTSLEDAAGDLFND